VVAVVALASSCSSDGPSLEEYSSSAAEVCAAHQREADELAVGVAGRSVADAAKAGASLSRDEVEALTALERPSEQRDVVDRWIDALGRRVTALEAYAGSLAASDGTEPVPVPEDLADATGDAVDAAEALGLQACGAGIDVVVGSATGPVGAAPLPEAPASTPPPTGLFGNPTDETITQDQ